MSAAEMVLPVIKFQFLSLNVLNGKVVVSLAREWRKKHLYKTPYVCTASHTSIWILFINYHLTLKTIPHIMCWSVKIYKLWMLFRWCESLGRLSKLSLGNLKCLPNNIDKSLLNIFILPYCLMLFNPYFSISDRMKTYSI